MSSFADNANIGVDTDIDPALLSHDNAGPRVNTVAWTLFTICTVFLSLRFYCKYLGRRGLWWDDWILLASWITHLISCALLSVMITQGYGKHPWDKGELKAIEVVTMMVRTTFTVTAAAWSKTAFAVTMLRIAEGWMKWALWFIIVSMNIAMGLNAMIAWVSCKPIQASWDITVKGSCLNLGAIVTIGNVSGAYSGVCDFLLALLPWNVIWKLQMQLKEKLGVGFAMSMGIAAGVMAAAKTSQLSQLDSGDSHDAAQLSIWDTAEISVTIIAASIPALRVLVRDVTSSTRRYYLQGSTTNNHRLSRLPTKSHHSVVVTSDGSDKRDDQSDTEILASSRAKIHRIDEVIIQHSHVTDIEAYRIEDRK